MISLAWSISLLLCVPQAFIFQGDSCRANFATSKDYPGWGVKLYVIWFAVANFFIPLGELSENAFINALFWNVIFLFAFKVYL